MIFVISTSLDSIQNSGTFFWGSKYFHTFSKYLPKDLGSQNINSAIIFFNKSSQKTKFAIQLKVDSFKLTNSSLQINYHFEKDLNYQSFVIKESLKNLLKLQSILEIPFVSVIDPVHLEGNISQTFFLSLINQLEEKKCWLEIYKLIEDELPDLGFMFWDDPKILSKISFATAKLAECSENLIKKFPNKEEREKYIKEKKHFRDLTIRLRKRTIELEPENPVYYSNLAYSYYQSAIELSTPGGRRDGKIIEDAYDAITYIGFALKLDKYRITDYYRRAILNSDIIAEQYFYKEIDENLAEKLEIYKDYLNEGIQDFLIIEKRFNDFNDDQKKRFKKIYIKSLYNLAQKYTRLAKLNFNPYNIIYGTNQKLFDEKNFVEIDLLKANLFINKCITEDYSKNKPATNLEELVLCNNFVVSVYKSYLKGTINLFLFYLTEKPEFEDEAKKFLHLAMETNFPSELKNQNKIFILEKIALLHLIKKEPHISIKILEPLYLKKNNFPPFAAYSLASAYYLNKNNDKALEIIDKFSSHNNIIFKHKFQKLMDLITKKDTILNKDKLTNPYIDMMDEPSK